MFLQLQFEAFYTVNLLNAKKKAARWDHLNGILQTSLEDKNTKPFYRYIKAQKNDNFGISSLKFNGLMYSDSSSKARF